jgi:hypothetical protein
MLRSTRAITLVLVGTASALLGYQALSQSDPENSGADFSDDSSNGYPTTGPSSGQGYFGAPHHHTGFWLWGSNSSWFHGSSYHSSYGGYSSSASHSGTSRGGFGHSGHAAGS